MSVTLHYVCVAIISLNLNSVVCLCSVPENGTAWMPPTEVCYRSAARTVNSGETARAFSNYKTADEDLSAVYDSDVT